MFSKKVVPLAGLEPAAYALRMRAFLLYLNDLAIFFLRFSEDRLPAYF